jgi:GTP-binding protein
MKTQFILSAAKRSGFPKLDLPEIALVGRSNVGKSSLLNALVGAKVARTSRTPGRTQLVNFFEVESKRGKFVLADLPGYGYAKVPTPERIKWKKLIEDYLLHREPLKLVLLLVDIRRQLTQEDADFFHALEEALAKRDGRVLVVATKSDKVAKADLKPALVRIGRALNLGKADVFPTSSSKHMGLDGLMAEIHALISAT